MKVTKYEHACIVLEEQGSRLVIDPGGFTPDFGGLAGIQAVVITHIHPDHFDPQHVKDILTANPEATVYTVQEVASQLSVPRVMCVEPGSQAQAGVFTLEFGGGKHALIHQSVPQPHNVAVLVNDSFFYPGDSFTLPGKPVDVLAVPSSAPWLKVSETIDYLRKVQTRVCIPTHDGLLSQNGRQVMNRLIGNACTAQGMVYRVLRPGEWLST